MPDIPSIHAIATLILTALALLLFTRERIPLETSSLLVLVLLTVGFELFPYAVEPGQQLHAVDFFSGFGHEALIAVCGLMIVGQGLVRTGALEPFGRLLSRLVEVSKTLGAEIVAEGIESRDDLALLKDYGVKYGQGWLWGKPGESYIQQVSC